MEGEEKERADESCSSSTPMRRARKKMASVLTGDTTDQTCSVMLADYPPIPPPYNKSSHSIMGHNDQVPAFSEVMMSDAMCELHEQRSELDKFCRICHDSDGEEMLITPCRCKGTLSMVHRSCLEKWLAASDSSSCELCGQFYVTIRTPKYRYLPSIVSWLRSEDSCRDVRELVLDLMALCVFTPMALLGTYLGLFAAENFYLTELDPARRDMTSARLVTLIVMSLMATIDLAYISWVTVRTQYHVQQWHSWWRRQCTVRLFLLDESTASNTTKSTAEISVTTRDQVNVHSGRCSTNASESSKSVREDLTAGDLSRERSDIYRVTLYDSSRVTTNCIPAESWCRICQESKSELLVTPCRCRGTQGFVHLSCLERWLTFSQSAACEVCFFPYCIKSVPKYSPFVSIFVWLYKSGNKKYMACDMAILLLLTSTMLWMIKHAWHLSKKESPQLLSPGVAFLTAVFSIAYVFLVYTTVRFYYKKWLVWHKSNQRELRVILHQDSLGGN